MSRFNTKLKIEIFTQLPKNPYSNLLFHHVDGFDFFLTFRVQLLSYVPQVLEGATAEFPTLGSSHNCLWIQWISSLYFLVLSVLRDFLVALAGTGKKDYPDIIHNLGVVKDWIKVVERGGYVSNWNMVEK